MQDVSSKSSQSTAGPSELRAIWRAFLQGLTEPSKGALATSLSVALLGFTACAVFLTPGFVAGPHHRYLAWGPGDTQLEVTSRALAAARSTLAGPAVFILGSSGIREAISTSEELVSLLRAGTSRPLEVFNCASYDQTPLEMAALVEQLPASFDGIVILGVNPCDIGAGPLQHHRDSANDYDVRFGFRSRIVDQAARRAGQPPPRLTGNYFVDNYRFLLPRLPFLLRNLFTGAPEERHHPWTTLAAPLDEQAWQAQAERVQRLMSAYHRHFDETFVYYQRMIAELQRRGRVDIVLLESPIRPRSLHETIGIEAWKEHVALVQAFAARTGTRYWNLNEHALLADEDFYDYVHLFRTDAQQRFTLALSEALSRLL